MRVLTNINEKIVLDKNTAIALGTFDGLHIAHEYVINQVVDIAKKKNLLSVVYTFTNHPKDMMASVETPKRLITPEQKIEKIMALGIDVLVLVAFDEFQISIDAEEFLKEILIKKLKAKHLVVGYDFRFGKNAKGCVNMLTEYANELNYEVDIINPIKLSGITVSSTVIRNYLLSGEVTSANELLGKKYSIKGVVVKGKQVGRKLGFPTINLDLEYEMTVLKPGVYATQTIAENNIYHSITNVGFNPTFNQSDFNIETYILDFDEDLYHEHVEVVFHKYMREEIKFDDIDELISQISEDVKNVKEFFNLK